MQHPDEPQVHIYANESHRGLVHIGIGTGQPAYNITSARAEELAAELVAAAAVARSGGGA
ncbi:MAG TPA: hypothetical protein PLK19_19180 [Mycobacterium sp.]|nr:hypothetical protein [Mycobacterium sp.]